MYVDVILPIPLNNSFTYLLPDSMPRAARGMRVLVPFGKTKTVIGLVVNCHEGLRDGSAAYEIKPVLEVLDTQPSLTEMQFRLWDWIAEYYLAPMGDVFKAAMPSGLKAEDNYKPKTELCVRLDERLQDAKTLHIVLSGLSRAKQQVKALEVLAEKGNMTRDELINLSSTNTSIIKQLVDKGFVKTYEREVGRLNTQSPYMPSLVNQLNEHQQKAFDEINASFEKHNVTLLHGVTSSGKTEIYTHLIKEQIEKGKQVLYLLPEIALTVQIMQRLKRIFGHRLGIYHSKYSDAERVEIWQKQLSDHPYDVILGVRSSVFLPFRNLGLVIVDEEHETSYKQQDPSPRYHARSVAIVLAQMLGAKTLLGTATPSLESMYNAKSGKFGLVTLNKRYKELNLPEVCVVDVKDLQRRKIMKTPFSPLLIDSMKEALANGEQVILFQNRRGFDTMIECKSCGWVPKCASCDVSLTYHKSSDTMTCHYCGRTYKVPEKCPECGNVHMHGKGFGTEKIEDYVRELFPEAKVARMDLDTTRTRSAYERIISDFAAGNTNVLIGTQMVSKGLDFDHVSVVGIINADSMLNYPDFRAYEHAFMMMTQVSGRAGRKGRQGKVILQTKSPTLPLMGQVVNNDYEAFFASLLEERQLFHYPPFHRVLYVYIKDKNNDVAERASIYMSGLMRQVFGERVLGPDRPAVAKVQSMFIRKIMLKLENNLPMREVRSRLLEIYDKIMSDGSYPGVQIYFDVDPL